MDGGHGIVGERSVLRTYPRKIVGRVTRDVGDHSLPKELTSTGAHDGAGSCHRHCSSRWLGRPPSRYYQRVSADDLAAKSRSRRRPLIIRHRYSTSKYSTVQERHCGNQFSVLSTVRDTARRYCKSKRPDAPLAPPPPPPPPPFPSPALLLSLVVLILPGKIKIHSLKKPRPHHGRQPPVTHPHFSRFTAELG